MENQPFFSRKKKPLLHVHGEAKSILASHNAAVHRLPFCCSCLSKYQKCLRERKFYLLPRNNKEDGSTRTPKGTDLIQKSQGDIAAPFSACVGALQEDNYQNAYVRHRVAIYLSD